MRRWQKVILGLIAAVAALYVVFQLIAPSHDWNQKLAVTIATPSGDVSGAAVVGVSVTSNIKFLPDAKGISTSLKGEATVVDLGGGRYVFALLNNNPTSLVRATHAQLLKDNDGKASPFYRALRSLRGQPRTVPSSDYPLLVTFADIKDPKSVAKVDPANLAASFGPGYSLKSITLEITDEKVTEGAVEKVLGWLTWPREKLLAVGGGRNPTQLAINGGYLALDRNVFRSK